MNLLNNSAGRKLVLASTSPRRKEILESVGADFEVVGSESFVELADGKNPVDLALFNAEGKTLEVSGRFSNAIVIGADTVVALGDQIIGKPKDRADAKRILEMLSGSTHKVVTAFFIIDTKTGKKVYGYEVTKIFMDEFGPEEIELYLDSNEGADKAGGYAIQGIGSLWINRIEGDYFNVVGMPINRIFKELKSF